jgi:hypothetical protein
MMGIQDVIAGMQNSKNKHSCKDKIAIVISSCAGKEHATYVAACRRPPGYALRFTLVDTENIASGAPDCKSYAEIQNQGQNSRLTIPERTPLY